MNYENPIVALLKTDGLSGVELPQEWVDINEAYEAIKEDDHKLLGGVIYKDFEGKIRVFPLAPPYSIRTDEVGEKYAQSTIAMYNSKQQLMVKPATDGRHTVSLRQLDEFFGGGSTSDLGEKAFSIRKVPPVDMSEPEDDYRMPYVFCRDTQNIFSAKYYNERPLPNTLVERMPNGQIACKDPEYDGNPVTLGYFNRAMSERHNSNVSLFLAKSGDTVKGRLTSHTSNPYFRLMDSSDGNNSSYFQAYQGKTYMGYSSAKSISVDKNGNAGVAGDLAVVGNVSCKTPSADGHAVNLGYLNETLANFSGGSGGSGENTAEAKTARDEAVKARDEAVGAKNTAVAIKDSLKKETWTFTLDDGTVVTKVVCVDVGA